MAQQLITTGNVAGDGTGDPLRDAFTKINNNFTELYSGNVQVTAANILVHSVAGRTGNIVLTVNDVAQAASKSYVNTAIASNLANVTGGITDSLNANITAANVIISNHAGRIDTLESNSATQATQIDNLVSVKANVSYVDTSINLALSSNAVLANVNTINANVAAANTNITALTTNSATQATQINSINANVLSANTQIASLQANTAAANVQIANLQANAATQALELDTLTANATTQQATINTLVSNAAVQSVAINDLNANIGSYQIFSNANAASQTIAIDALNSNIAAANINISSLTSNAATQALELTNLQSNAQAQQSNITDLQSNAATQSTQINSISANVVTLLANSATQSVQIDLINANVTAANVVLSTLSANAATQALELDNLQSNAQAQQTNIAALQSNAAAQSIQINLVNANVSTVNANITAANLAILARANLSGATFTGNVSADYIQAANTVRTNTYFIGGSAINQGLGESWANPAALFFGNTLLDENHYLQVNLQNLDPTGSGDFVVTADDGNDASNFIALGMGGSQFFSNDAGYASSLPHDGYVWVWGGNLDLQSRDGNVELISGDLVSGQLIVSQSNVIYFGQGVSLAFPDGTIQSTAFGGNAALNTLNANIGAFQTYANLTFGPDSYSNANVESYLAAFDGNIVPSANVTYDLGSSTNRWRDLWLSGNTIYIGQANITANGTAISLPAGSTIAGSPIGTSADNELRANVGAYQTYANANAATQATSLENINANVGAYQTYANATFGGGSYSDSNVQTYLGQFDGNIVPSANVTYDLGSSTNRWRDLWLSGNTINLGNATLSVVNESIQSSLPIEANITASNITVSGTRIDFASGGYIEETEVLDGNLQPAGYFGISINSSDDGIISLNAIDSNATVMSSVFVTNVNVQLNVANSTPGGNALPWIFNNYGYLTWPDNTSLNTANIMLASFEMANVQHWTSNVSTIGDAINQLAERIYNIENP